MNLFDNNEVIQSMASGWSVFRNLTGHSPQQFLQGHHIEPAFLQLILRRNLSQVSYICKPTFAARVYSVPICHKSTLKGSYPTVGDISGATCVATFPVVLNGPTERSKSIYAAASGPMWRRRQKGSRDNVAVRNIRCDAHVSMRDPGNYRATPSGIENQMHMTHLENLMHEVSESSAASGPNSRSKAQ